MIPISQYIQFGSKMRRFLDGNPEQVLEMLGIDPQWVKGKPEKVVFQAIMQHISMIDLPTSLAAILMSIFGKNGHLIFHEFAYEPKDPPFIDDHEDDCGIIHGFHCDCGVEALRYVK